MRVFLPVLLLLHLAEVWVVWWSMIRNSFWPCRRDSPLVERGIGSFLEDMWRWVRACGWVCRHVVYVGGWVCRHVVYVGGWVCRHGVYVGGWVCRHVVYVGGCLP